MHYFSPLTPVTFLERSAKVFPDAAAVTDERRSVTYRQLLSRARRLAAALRALGVGDGDRVGLMADNCRLTSDVCRLRLLYSPRMAFSLRMSITRS